VNRLHKNTVLEVTSLRDSVNTVREKLDDRMNENMSVVHSQIEKASKKVNQEIRSIKGEVGRKANQ
jgi:predicted nuclease with TOPRIM domain